MNPFAIAERAGSAKDLLQPRLDRTDTLCLRARDIQAATRPQRSTCRAQRSSQSLAAGLESAINQPDVERPFLELLKLLDRQQLVAMAAVARERGAGAVKGCAMRITEE